ncbi:Unknown protein sequence [Pseudomonas syringae pv. maculicola]|nr:Unknown protein sequence [Pseudomonas syringae pv. maculicola]
MDCSADTFKFSMSKNILSKFFVTALSLLLFRPARLATE